MYRATLDPPAAVNNPALAPYFTGPALQLVLTSPESNPDLEVRVVFLAEESAVDGTVIRIHNATRASETKKPVLRCLGRGLGSGESYSASSMASRRGGRMIGDRAAALVIKLPGGYPFL